MKDESLVLNKYHARPNPKQRKTKDYARQGFVNCGYRKCRSSKNWLQKQSGISKYLEVLSNIKQEMKYKLIMFYSSFF